MKIKHLGGPVVVQGQVECLLENICADGAATPELMVVVDVLGLVDVVLMWLVLWVGLI